MTLEVREFMSKYMVGHLKTTLCIENITRKMFLYETVIFVMKSMIAY